MKVKQRLQFLLLSLSIVSFFLLIFLFFVANRNDNPESIQNSRQLNSLKVSNEQISFFLDTNNNQTKDNEEELCEQCATKQILLEVNSREGRKLIVKEIAENGSLQIRSTELISLWGYLPDEKLVIPVHTFSSDMAGTDIFIPVIKLTYELIGENANISSISASKLSQNNYQIEFEFNTLIPALNNFVNSDSPIWFLYYPSNDQIDKYYLSPATVNTQGTSKSNAKTYWHFTEEHTNLESIDNYRLLIPSI